MTEELGQTKFLIFRPSTCSLVGRRRPFMASAAETGNEGASAEVAFLSRREVSAAREESMVYRVCGVGHGLEGKVC